MMVVESKGYVGFAYPIWIYRFQKPKTTSVVNSIFNTNWSANTQFASGL